MQQQPTNEPKSILAASVMAARGAGLTLEQFKTVAIAEYIIAVLVDHKYNQCHTAASLGMHRNTLPRICAKYGINIRAMRDSKKPPQPTRRVSSYGKRQAG